MTDARTDRPHTHEMVVIHRVFRREFRLLPDLLDTVRAGDTARANLLADHADDLVTALHHHHDGEDELLWPKLLERASMHTALIERMESQHQALADALQEVERLVPRYREQAGADVRDELSAALRQVSHVLDQHLSEEEVEILPITAEHLTTAEWDELGERGMESIPKPKLVLFLGMILEDADDAERRAFLAKLPLMGRLMWHAVGRRQYARYVHTVRSFTVEAA